MKMIDMRKRKKSVQRRVNRGRNRVPAERAKRIKLHNLVFMVCALVTVLKRQQLVLVERREPGALHAAQVASRTLHPQYFDRLASQRVRVGNL